MAEGLKRAVAAKPLTDLQEMILTFLADESDKYHPSRAIAFACYVTNCGPSLSRLFDRGLVEAIGRGYRITAAGIAALEAK